MRRYIAIGFALIFIAAGGLAAASVLGVPQSVLSEVANVKSIPDGRYEEVRNWSAVKLFHLTGQVSTDSEASGGRAWDAVVDKNTPGFMIYGPYDQLIPGNYAAFFRVKMTDEPDDSSVAVAEVYANKGNTKLAVRMVIAADLKVGKYVEIPVFFRCANKDVEYRLHWSGTTSLRVDRVTVYRYSGNKFPTADVSMVPLPVSPEKIKGLKYKPAARAYADIFPQSSKPASKLLVCDLTKTSPDWAFLITTLQGIVNRVTPRIYCLDVQTDRQWLEWNIKQKRVTETETVTPKDLIDRFANEIKGVVITDPRLPSTKNIATMLAGVENAVVITPRLAKQLKLSVVADLRNRWTKNADAYRWAFKTLWDRMDHNTAACLWPDAIYSRDYLVQHRIFIFWLPGRIDGAQPYADPAEELKFAEELLAAMSTNVPIMGYSWAGEDVGMGEGPGVGLMAEYGKYLVGSVDVPNMSVHSGYKVQPFVQKKLEVPPVEDNKVYFAYTMSDGDNIPVMTTSNWPQLWQQPERGRFPIGWTISPASCLLIPDIMDYYYSTASPNDSFLAAVSGVGYTYLNLYGKRIDIKERSRMYDGFMDLTQQYMQRMGLNIVCPSGAGDSELKRYALGIPSLEAIFADYGKTVNNYQEATHMTSRNIPIFHAVCSWDPKGDSQKQIADTVKQIRQMAQPKDRPAFMHVFLCNWFWDLSSLEEVIKRLGDGYVAVSPDQLSAMYREWISRQQVVARMPVDSVMIESYGFNTTYIVQNVTGKSMHAAFSVSGLKGASVRPSSAELVPGREYEVTVKGNPVSSNVTVTAKGTFGNRKSVTKVRKLPAAEILGKLPKNITLKFISDRTADSLPHLTGELKSNADGSVCWTVKKGTHKAGHMSYGPYAGLEAGKYLAVFRIKRVGEGSGDVALLDACVAASQNSSATRLLKANELPLNKYRSVPLVFNHPGGTYETRVLWIGKASLELDRIVLWKIQ